MNRLEYKGYWTNIEYSAKDKVLYGKIEGIGDLVNFESNDASGIENEFHLAVDDYLEFCRELGKEPERAYKGSFNVRISPNLHKKLAIYSAKQRVSLNDSVEQAIKYYLDNAMEDRFLKKFPIIIKDKPNIKAKPARLAASIISNSSIKLSLLGNVDCTRKTYLPLIDSSKLTANSPSAKCRIFMLPSGQPR